MRKFVSFLMIFALTVTLSFASQVERLVNTLVEEGVISQGQAYRIIAESKEEARKEQAITMAEIEKVQVSGWIKDTKFSGDARLRYEMHGRENHSGSPITDRHRTRIRFRWGFETKVNEQISAGLRLATGDSSTQATTANQTFTGAFNDKHIWLDRAYVKYSPMDNLVFTGGKMSNPFYATSLVWSGDVNPEGFVMQAKFPVGSEIFATAGYFPVWERGGDSTDPYMIGAQIGYSGKLADAAFKAAATIYNYTDLKGLSAASVSPGQSNAGNSLIGGDYEYDYRLFNMTAELTPFNLPMGESTMPVKFYGDYVKNIASDVKDDTGYLFGLQLGRARNAGTWQASYDYRRLEADAVLDFMTDGSFSQGGTDSKGHSLGFRYATSNRSTLGVSYLITEGLGNRKKLDVNTLQVDYAVSF